MQSLKNEISRETPSGFKSRKFRGGEPILYAFDCALLERETVSGFVYSIENLNNGKTEILSRRKTPLTTSLVEDTVRLIRQSKIAGAGHYEADRPFGERISYDKARAILHRIFKKIMPGRGYAIRREQIDLADHILSATAKGGVTLAEAEVGTGKTHAYLAAAIIAKRGRMNDYRNASLYPDMPYAATVRMPIVIATSSIALQRAILTEHIPELSRMLVKSGVIKTSLTAVLRKGKENYICERNLRGQLLYESNPAAKEILNELLSPSATIDLAETDGLTPHIRRNIAVPKRCYNDCPHRDSCQYLRYRKDAQSSAIDIQICNHNYILADTLRRAGEERPLIPNYQILVIDEAHKFLATARTMYGTELSSEILPEILRDIAKLNFKSAPAQKTARRAAKKLADTGKRLFESLLQFPSDKENDRFTVHIDEDNARRLRNIRDLSDGLNELLDAEPLTGYGAERKSQIMWDLGQAREQAAELARYADLICWLEADKGETRLCAIPKDLDKCLFRDQWSKGIPTILTSGTLSAGGDFTRTKQLLGLERLGGLLTETSKPSPFDHEKNTLLYISETMPFPDQRSNEYIAAVADEVEKLVIASHGHAAVLFTSYKAMDMVWEKIAARHLPFPLFRLDKGGVREIEKFKQSGNGVLFAAGALWEGIDIPGDALSMLIIVKLPFQVPDPISEYERTQYPNFRAYRDAVILPDMLIKGKQGCGRLIRLETDTGCIALLDSRANRHGIYRVPVLSAWPPCRVTDKISDIADFMRAVKSPEYFM
jgi:ATP-dependent DNA helicase DinG